MHQYFWYAGCWGINVICVPQDTYKDCEKIEKDGIDKVDATIIRLAVDGLWLSEIFGLDT